MSEVFTDPVVVAATVVPTTALPTTTIYDLENHGIQDEDVHEYNGIASSVEPIPLQVSSGSIIDNDTTPKMYQDVNTTLSRSRTHTNAATAAATTTTSKRGVSSFCHYTNIMTLIIICSMVLAGVYGILQAAKVFDSSTSTTTTTTMDDNNNNNKNNTAPISTIVTTAFPVSPITNAPTSTPMEYKGY